MNLSCAGVSHPTRWVWAPSFPTCKGLPKGRRRILWASASGTPAVSAVQPFAGRLRALDHPGIRRLELLLSAGDSGIFICRGRHEDESHTVLRVLGDAADCPGPGPGLGRWKPPRQAALTRTPPHPPTGKELGWDSGEGAPAACPRTADHALPSPRGRAPPAADPPAGRRAAAGTRSVGSGLVAAAVSSRGRARGGRVSSDLEPWVWFGLETGVRPRAGGVEPWLGTLSRTQDPSRGGTEPARCRAVEPRRRRWWPSETMIVLHP